MTKEEKELLIKDLCGRLPYGVKVLCLRDFNHDWYNLEMVDIGDNEVYITTYESYTNRYVKIEEVKLYLFPLSSMTEEQKEDLLLAIVGKEWVRLFSVTKDGIISNDKAEQSFENFSLNNINFSNKNIEVYIDWLNKNHFDYRGLIAKGLAIDCTNLNIY